MPRFCRSPPARCIRRGQRHRRAAQAPPKAWAHRSWLWGQPTARRSLLIKPDARSFVERLLRVLRQQGQALRTAALVTFKYQGTLSNTSLQGAGSCSNSPEKPCRRSARCKSAKCHPASPRGIVVPRPALISYSSPVAPLARPGFRR